MHNHRSLVVTLLMLTVVQTGVAQPFILGVEGAGAPPAASAPAAAPLQFVGRQGTRQGTGFFLELRRDPVTGQTEVRVVLPPGRAADVIAVDYVLGRTGHGWHALGATYGYPRTPRSAYMSVPGGQETTGYAARVHILADDAIEAWVRLRHTTPAGWERLPVLRRFAPSEDLVVIAAGTSGAGRLTGGGEADGGADGAVTVRAPSGMR
jgi:hypothetical protein